MASLKYHKIKWPKPDFHLSPKEMYLELPKHATTDSVYSAIAIRRAVATYQLKVIVPWPWGLDVLEKWGMCDTVDGRNPAPPVVSETL